MSNKQYSVNRNTDRTWVEVCDSAQPHINGCGTPVARVADEALAEMICGLLNGDVLLPNLQPSDELDYLALHTGIIFGSLSRLRAEGRYEDGLKNLYAKIALYLPSEVFVKETERRVNSAEGNDG